MSNILILLSTVVFLELFVVLIVKNVASCLYILKEIISECFVPFSIL